MSDETIIHIYKSRKWSVMTMKTICGKNELIIPISVRDRIMKNGTTTPHKATCIECLNLALTEMELKKQRVAAKLKRLIAEAKLDLPVHPRVTEGP